MADVLGRQSGLVENEPGAAAHLLQLEARDRIDAVRHAADAPCLHDAAAGFQLDVDAADVAAVGEESAADLGADLDLAVGGEGCVLLRAHQRAVDAGWWSLERDLL